MMTTQQNTRLYKVVFENLGNNKIYSENIEACSAFEAGEILLEKVGKGYDILKVTGVKPTDLS